MRDYIESGNIMEKKTTNIQSICKAIICIVNTVICPRLYLL